MTDRLRGAGPFKAANDEYPFDDMAQGGWFPLYDASGQPFAWVNAADCIGHDGAAAKARLTRIAEALNR